MLLSQDLQDLLVDGDYPRNAAGETYGSWALASVVGDKPDLSAAIGIDGTHGYIRREDISPDIATPEEALAYMETRPETPYLIPLYDKEGEVIGQFRITGS